MKNKTYPAENSRLARLKAAVIGQHEPLVAIDEAIEVYEANLADRNRPAGVFFLLGPTGVGKTHTVRTLARLLHGSSKAMIRIDCGEFQMEHEVAKLIGAPPGYLGHRETKPVLSQSRLTGAASSDSNLAIILFDEIEKAAPSMVRLLLGVLDNGTLALGDGTLVDFEHTLIFFTSNVGAAELQKQIMAPFGLGPRRDDAASLGQTAKRALRARFSPEFINRLDHIFTYEPLKEEHLQQILTLELRTIEERTLRGGYLGITVELDDAARAFILSQGEPALYGAREIKRTLQRHIVNPMARLLNAGTLERGGALKATHPRHEDETLTLTTSPANKTHAFNADEIGW